MKLAKKMFFIFVLLTSIFGYSQNSPSEIQAKESLIGYFKHIHYEKQVAYYDSLSWCDKLSYYVEIENLPKRKRKKINSAFVNYMLNDIRNYACYTSGEGTAVGVYYRNYQMWHNDIAVWRKILSCE